MFWFVVGAYLFLLVYTFVNEKEAFYALINLINIFRKG